jgi:heme oxygenase
MHTALKRETAPLHHKLNTLPNARVLVTPRLRIPDYSRILMAYAKAYEQLEQVLIPLEREITLGGLPPYTQRLAAIHRDIEALDEYASRYKPDTRPIRMQFEARTFPHYLGLRYVVDGSTQGGAFIERRLRKNIPELASRAFSLWGVQEKAAAGWPLLCAAIDDVSEKSEQAEEIIDAANAAFQLFIECFSFSE